MFAAGALVHRRRRRSARSLVGGAERVAVGADRGREAPSARLAITASSAIRRAPPGTVYRVSDLELASRLSFFLWSSIPDDELLDAAERSGSTSRRSSSSRCAACSPTRGRDALVENFAGQWLFLRNIREVTPDPRHLPGVRRQPARRDRRETELFIDSQLREDRSVLELLNADYTFVNERLAKHYGIPDVYGSQFRRVELGRLRPRRACSARRAC